MPQIARSVMREKPAKETRAPPQGKGKFQF
jgi:hypothetical protein